jgi:hypothetical protein
MCVKPEVLICGSLHLTASSEPHSSVWSTCYELRGGIDASQYKDYVPRSVVDQIRQRQTR